ncbi:MAG: putative Ig domain-containing protein [Candidatus Micrarchaeota archaeon]|nr:putative Ig domain-containing protein [Candidatus Micrarchaeota archaeon]
MRLVILAAITVAFLLFFGCAGTSNQTAENSGSIAINTSVKINGASALPAATSGQLYNTKITVSGGSAPYNCSAAPGTTMPGALVFSEPGCSITGTAPILDSGTPTAIYPISVLVRDSQGNSESFKLMLAVNQPAPKLVLPEEIPAAEIGKYYEYNFCVPSSQSMLDCGQLPGFESVTSPFTFTVSGQPIGLSMSTNGLLSGTVPVGAITNNYAITVCVTDLVGTETCADTTLPVVAQQESQQPGNSSGSASTNPPGAGSASGTEAKACDSPYDGNWAGSVEGSGSRYPRYEYNSKTPLTIKYTFEMTLKCDYKDTGSNGEPLYWENVTYAKVSDPFFGCMDGCTPILGYSSSNIDMPAPGTGGEVYMNIDFPNGIELVGAGLKPNADATSFVDEDNTGSGNLGSGRNDDPPYREEQGCADCSFDMKHYKIEIHKV